MSENIANLDRLPADHATDRHLEAAAIPVTTCGHVYTARKA